MPEDEVTPNIGDESNQTGVAEKSALEKAKDDDRRLDLAALTFNDEGDVAPETLRQFVDSMPVAEQTGLRNPDGTPTRQASDRLMAAIFWKAYGSDELVRQLRDALGLTIVLAVPPPATGVGAAVADRVARAAAGSTTT
jgi:hypothetical protein